MSVHADEQRLEEALRVRRDGAMASLPRALSPLTGVRVAGLDGGTGDGSLTMEGYAAVLEQETTLVDIPGWIRIREEIARDAFDDVMARLAHGDGLVHLNHGHDMKTAVAATNVSGIGGLELSTDFHGLRFFARVDRDDTDAKSLAVKMSRGVVAQSSFAFTIGDEELVEDNYDAETDTLDLKFRINRIQDLFDVCVCAQGAYPQTESIIRSLAAATGRSVAEGLQRRLDVRGASDAAPDEVGAGGDQERNSERENLLTRANAALSSASLIGRDHPLKETT